MIFAPVSVHPDCLSLSANFSLNTLADLDSPSKSSGSLRVALLNRLMPVVEVESMGTAVLACPGVRANGIADGTFGAGLNHPPPAGTVPPPPPLGVVPVDVEEEMDLVDLAILSVGALGNSLVVINKVNLKDNQCRYLL